MNYFKTIVNEVIITILMIKVFKVLIILKKIINLVIVTILITKICYKQNFLYIY